MSSGGLCCGSGQRCLSPNSLAASLDLCRIYFMNSDFFFVIVTFGFVLLFVDYCFNFQIEVELPYSAVWVSGGQHSDSTNPHTPQGSRGTWGRHLSPNDVMTTLSTISPVLYFSSPGLIYFQNVSLCLLLPFTDVTTPQTVCLKSSDISTGVSTRTAGVCSSWAFL